MLRSIDHVVLTASDLDATVEFYVDVLGAELIRFDEGRLAIQVGDQKINLHPASAPLQPHATSPEPGSLDICFVTDLTLDEVVARLRSADIEIEEGPVAQTGALGQMTSIYFRDPDGNLIEIAKYDP